MRWEYLAIAALVLLGLEMLTPMTVFLWLAAGTAAASLASFYGIGWQGQIAIFLLGLAASLASFFLRKRPQPGADVSAPGSVLVGLTGTALGEIAPHGRVLVADGSWGARSADGQSIADGTPVTVTGHSGATLLVQPTQPFGASSIIP